MATSAASNSALTLATGDWTALLDHDDELAEHALYMLATEAHHADLVYSDEDKIDAHGRLSEPHFKPDWNPDLAISHNYVGHLCAIRAATVRELGGFRVGFEGSQDHDLVLRVAREARASATCLTYSTTGARSKVHRSFGGGEGVRRGGLRSRAARSHGHARRRGILPLTYPGALAGPTAPPLISLIIPTRDARRLLEKCIDTAATEDGVPGVRESSSSTTRAVTRRPCGISRSFRTIPRLASSATIGLSTTPPSTTWRAECSWAHRRAAQQRPRNCRRGLAG